MDTCTDRDATQNLFDSLLKRATAAGVTLRSPPPEPTTCCGRGCNGCVWESYHDAVVWWREESETALNARSR